MYPSRLAEDGEHLGMTGEYGVVRIFTLPALA